MTVKRPFPRYKQMDNVPTHEVAAHLEALMAEGYELWSLQVSREVHTTQTFPDNKSVCHIETFWLILVWWALEEDEDAGEEFDLDRG